MTGNKRSSPVTVDNAPQNNCRLLHLLVCWSIRASALLFAVMSLLSALPIGSAGTQKMQSTITIVLRRVAGGCCRHSPFARRHSLSALLAMRERKERNVGLAADFLSNRKAKRSSSLLICGLFRVSFYHNCLCV